MVETNTSQSVCRICGNAANNNQYTAHEMMYGLREPFDYFECGNCKCLQIEEMPRDMSRFYPENYYSFGKFNGKKFRGFKGRIKKFQYRNSVLGTAAFKRLFGISEFKILDGLEIHRESRILDVGCGNGHNFLYPLAEAGFTNVFGCDPYLSDPLTYDNGLGIRKSDIFGMTGKWDVITYHHAFEHLPNPKENLQKVHDLLTKSGVCIIRIPSVSSYAWEHYSTDWVQLDAPRHFFLYSKESIGHLAEEAGMTLDRIVYDSTHFQFIGSEKYKRDIPLSASKEKGLLPSIRRKWDKWRYQQRANRLNREGRGDQAAFFLRKK